MKKILLIIIVLFIGAQIPFAQESTIDVSKMTKEDVLNLTYDQLLEMPFEDLIKLAEIVGVSLDELYEMILNKDLVSASKKVESSFEAPLSTSVISHDDIIASGARTIEEALRLVPGLIVREKTNGNFDVHIRGNDNVPPKHMFVYSENSITLVMIDGRPVYNYVHGGTFWETIPVDVEDIDRIEVVRGPSSALYGPNAVSGVVNIITRKQDSEKLSVSGNVQGGMQNSLLSDIALGKRLGDKFAFRVTGNFQTLDRNTGKLYVHKANRGAGGFITKEELAELPDYVSGRVDTSTYRGNISELIQPAGDTNYYYRVFDPHDDVNDMYSDPLLARTRYGGNVYLFYDLSEKATFDLKGGYQSSEVISSTMGDNPSSFAGRVSQTYYTDFNANLYGVHAQFNSLGGWQDIVKSDTGFKVDLYNFNANLEYDLNLKNLNLRPGLTYQHAKYNDMPYLRYEGQGFLNGERDFTTLAISLRADYLLLKKIRLIGALRGEKYSTNDDIYLSYQLIGSYNLNNKHNFRIVHSRANRSPFLVDSYADYLWVREGRPNPGYVYFKGQENLDLLTMNMLELGYRLKPIKQLQADIECFYTKTKDFGALYPDSVNLNGANLGLDRPWVRMKFQNISMTSQQFGLTSSINYVISERMYMKFFITYQITQLKNVIPISQDQTIEFMLRDAFLHYPNDSSSTNFIQEREDIKNQATPSLFGGFTINYKPIEKLNINVNGYFYSKEIFDNKYSPYIDFEYNKKTIKARLILNTKISYSIHKNISLYLNARNLIGSEYEFAYMDKIGLLLLLGASFNF